MCGIAGFIARPGTYTGEGIRLNAEAMGASLRHRGPDEGGTWFDDAAGVALVHRRLSIIDLSVAGHQPMVSACGRFTLAYNGEIYNADELRTELRAAGRSFRGHSDTEVIVEAIAAWGIDRSVCRAWGMFAFACWDRQTRTLYLARDRLGIKPLYWGQFPNLFVFGSELKALNAHGGWKREIDRGALAGYVRFGYVPSPKSIWSGVSKLEPGTILAVSPDGQAKKRVYWSAKEVARSGIRQRETKAFDEASMADRLEVLLKDSVRRHMVSDVPLGAFLSGGYDSSTVVAMMQSQSSRPVRTFSIGFQEDGYDESAYAKAVAGHLGTDHTELYLRPEHARDVIPRLPEIYDEPFGDSSQIPTLILCELTRRSVTVALSGDGGDELFAGYARYARALELWRQMNRAPAPLRRALGAGLRAMPPLLWDRVVGFGNTSWRRRLNSEKLHRWGRQLGKGREAIYGRLVGYWDDPFEVVRSVDGRNNTEWDEELRAATPDFLDWMQLVDTVTYLPDDILTKVDRASMAVSLEVRVPLLDHRLVEFAWALPQGAKFRQRESKYLLRQVLYRYVPRDLVDRPKMGFGVPIDSWLRGPLREWAESLLSQDRLEREGYFNPEPIRRLWGAHLSGESDWQYVLWPILMFQAWHEVHGTA